MPDTLVASINLDVKFTLTGDADLGVESYALPYNKRINFANGTGSGQANQVWTDTRTIAASTSENIDLAGVLTNALGSTVTLARVKAIIIAASASNVNNVVIGGNSNGLVNWVGNVNDVVNIRPGGFICLAAPDAIAYAVTASTGDILQVANSGSGTPVTYDIIVIGVA